MGLTPNTLKNTVSDQVSIDAFEPKSGHSHEVIVVAMLAEDLDPANDLGDFITKGNVGIIDVDVSPNPNEDGLYVVFIEFPREGDFIRKLKEMLRDVDNITSPLTWQIMPYHADQSYPLDDPTWEAYVITSPDEYVSKEDFVVPEMDIEESVKTFLSHAMCGSVIVEGDTVTFASGGRNVVADVVTIGTFNDLSERHSEIVTEQKMRLESNSEVRAISAIMSGEYEVVDLGQHVCVTKDDMILVLNNVEYR